MTLNFKSILSKENILFVLFLILFMYISIYGDWHYDEAWTYRDVSNNSVLDLLSYDKFKFANNHLFNSMYFRFLQFFDIKALFVYRFISLGAFFLFYFGSIKILGYYKINYLFVIFLILAPYFFYFSVGRGYALAIGAFVNSFYYLLQYIDSKKVKYEYGIVLMGILSCLSIFSFVYIFVSILIVYSFFKLKHIKSIHTIILFLLSICSLFYVYYLGKIVNDFDHYIPGGDSLFINGTISSLISDFTLFVDFEEYSFQNIIKVILVLTIIAPFFFLRRFLSSIEFKKDLIPLLLIILSFMLMIIASKFTTAKYPLNRAVFYIHFLLIFSFIIFFVKYVKLFILPLILIASLSIVFISLTIIDYKNATKIELIKSTNQANLYIISHDPTFFISNDFNGFNKKGIVMNRESDEIKKMIALDSSFTKYLICKEIDLKVFNNKLQLIKKGRSKYNLYKL